MVEVSADEIILRVDTRWLRFASDRLEDSAGRASSFSLNENGTVTLDGSTEEMDFAAERVAREMMHQ